MDIHAMPARTRLYNHFSIIDMRASEIYNMKARILDLEEKLGQKVSAHEEFPLHVWWDLPTTTIEDMWWFLRYLHHRGRCIAAEVACLAARRVLRLANAAHHLLTIEAAHHLLTIEKAETLLRGEVRRDDYREDYIACSHQVNNTAHAAAAATCASERIDVLVDGIVAKAFCAAYEAHAFYGDIAHLHANGAAIDAIKVFSALSGFSGARPTEFGEPDRDDTAAVAEREQQRADLYRLACSEPDKGDTAVVAEREQQHADLHRPACDQTGEATQPTEKTFQEIIRQISYVQGVNDIRYATSEDRIFLSVSVTCGVGAIEYATETLALRSRIEAVLPPGWLFSGKRSGIVQGTEMWRFDFGHIVDADDSV